MSLPTRCFYAFIVAACTLAAKLRPKTKRARVPVWIVRAHPAAYDLFWSLFVSRAAFRRTITFSITVYDILSSVYTWHAAKIDTNMGLDYARNNACYTYA
jgi:hypothetical protein